MEDTRRVLLAFLLVFAILFVWTLLGSRQNVPSPAGTQSAATGTEPPTMPSTGTSGKVVLPSTPEEFQILENDRLRITFSSLGGTIVSVRLKGYDAELVPRGGRWAALTLDAEPGTLDLTLLSMNGQRCSDRELEYTAQIESLEVVRRYELGDDYVLKTALTVRGLQRGYLLRFDSGPALTEPNRNEDLHHILLLTHNKALNKYGTKQVRNNLRLDDHYRWAGVRTMYFMVAVLPEEKPIDLVRAFLLPDQRIGWQVGTKALSSSDRFSLYFGPLKYELLRIYGLQGAFDFGRLLFIDLTWIGLPILKLLQWLFALLKNFGLAIIIFAAIIKVIFYPLSRIQQKQMKTMALLQPKLEELKVRYKNDREGLNRETMQLYKLYKINPFSGCLPLLIQMPIFFALYQVLRFTVEIRQAGFMFWIRDLSVKDPYYVLPILMGGFSILQSLLTSTGQQNRLLMFLMPVFITIIFLNFPSGLQLYWLIFNILSIIESIIAQGGVKWRKKTEQARLTKG